MIIVEKLGYIFLKKHLMCLVVLRSLKYYLKKGYSIKSLRMNRSEFCYNDFNEFCEDQGKNRLLTVARSP
jgi:hypothetical protein